MIDGFRLTVTRQDLAEREIVNHDIRSAEQRADAFAFMREHILVPDIHLLGSISLDDAELLPAGEEDMTTPVLHRTA